MTDPVENELQFYSWVENELLDLAECRLALGDLWHDICSDCPDILETRYETWQTG